VSPSEETRTKSKGVGQWHKNYNLKKLRLLAKDVMIHPNVHSFKCSKYALGQTGFLDN
jgi:hypothetical protein